MCVSFYLCVCMCVCVCGSVYVFVNVCECDYDICVCECVSGMLNMIPIPTLDLVYGVYVSVCVW